MPSKQECDRYADELNQRFEEFMQWAIRNWPRKDFPLMRSDFDASRRELSEILGPKLGDPDEAQDPSRVPGFEPPVGPGRSGRGEFRDVNPMPWP